ncbi:MAG: DNA integrity scanning protein DisA nucleotide-binding domain protein [Candidatus Omnitrophica bacterium]|nr:DNA integrity scanning protein DisA nucleotide-binding domain protein [Candidatus Omnitrophota bacterium]
MGIDAWSEVEEFRPFLLLLILSFFLISPALEWMEERRIEAKGKKLFQKSAREIQLAFQALAGEKIGALAAIEREDSLEGIVKKGIPVGGEITKEVLATLFAPYTPTHDGGAVLRRTKIAACGCVFPLSTNEHLSSDLGTRHRAALGLAEKTDALVIVASEESGELSIASHSKLEHNIAPEELGRKILREFSKTRHKTSLHMASIPPRRMALRSEMSKSAPSFSRRFLLLCAALFFLSLFLSFFPHAENFSVNALTANPWGWVYAAPLLASLILFLCIGSGKQILFYPALRQAERKASFLGVSFFKRRYSYEKLKGLAISPSRKWKDFFELRLVHNRFTSWLVYESKNFDKLEQLRLALDPPRSESNFGHSSSRP